MKLARTGLLALAVAGLACSSPGSATAPGGGTFVAFASDFKGFHDWPNQAEAFPSPTLPPLDGGVLGDAGTPGVDGGVHPVPQHEYWNMNPATGSTTFPVGFIVVKETEEADPVDRKVFAMVKRGGSFNVLGARGWELFELTNNTDGSVDIQWHGYGPPAGSKDIYGGNPNVCNGCHKIAEPNDFIWSAALQLSNF
jgi:hypothetical protein